MLLRLWGVMLASLACTAQEQNLFKEKEAKLGAVLAEEVRRRTTPLERSAVLNYVERVGRRLTAQFGGTGFAATFTVIADGRGGRGSRTHEPLSFPGGYIFVPAVLILAAENEAELAGMLAHAVAHVAEGHGTRMGTRRPLANASVPLIYLGGWSGMGGDEQTIPVALLGFQRTWELEADRLAVRMMAAAGYDPGALVRYIGRAQPENNDRLAFSPLPSRATRIANLEQAIRELPARTYSSSEEFYLIRAEILRLTPVAVRRPPSLGPAEPQ